MQISGRGGYIAALGMSSEIQSKDMLGNVESKEGYDVGGEKRKKRGKEQLRTNEEWKGCQKH